MSVSVSLYLSPSPSRSNPSKLSAISRFSMHYFICIITSCFHPKPENVVQTKRDTLMNLQLQRHAFGTQGLLTIVDYLITNAETECSSGRSKCTCECPEDTRILTLFDRNIEHEICFPNRRATKRSFDIRSEGRKGT